MAEIKLTHDQVAKVDEEFMERTIKLSDLKWHAIRSKSGGYHATCTLVMHRLVIDAPQGMIVDHKDRDGLNNLAENLRLVTVAGNAANRPTAKSSRFIGVTRIQIKTGIRWRAYLSLHGKYTCVGHYIDEEAAAIARDEAAFEVYGETAELNFPRPEKDQY